MTLWASRSRHSFPPEANTIADLVDKNDKKAIDNIKNSIDWTKIDVFQFGVTMFNAVFLTPAFITQKLKMDD